MIGIFSKRAIETIYCSTTVLHLLSTARRRFPGYLGSAVSAGMSSSARWMKITFRLDSLSRNETESRCGVCHTVVDEE